MAIKKPGTYAPLSSYYFDDVAIMEAGEDAELLFVRMLAYASRQIEMEGHIPKPVVQARLGILPRYESGHDTGHGTGQVPGTDALSRADKLVEVGLLDEEDDGYQIVSWLRWNKSAEEANRTRAADRKRKRRQRAEKKKKEARKSGQGTGQRTGQDAGQPQKSGDHNTEYKTHNSRGEPLAFEEFYNAYPKKVDRLRALPAWKAVIKKKLATEQQLIEAAKTYAKQMGNTDKRYIKAPASWLNAGSWENDPSEEASSTQGPTQPHVIMADELPMY